MNFLTDWNQNEDYFSFLQLIAGLSNLFSDSAVPYISYRVAENSFCKFYGAENISRSDIAYDAKIGTFGIGIKTFALKSNSSIEKIAEFDSCSEKLRKLNKIKLAKKVSELRNERNITGKNIYGIEETCYHIINRTPEKLILYNTQYSQINIKNIRIEQDKGNILRFNDGNNFYSFNKSKNTLYERFTIPNDERLKKIIPVSIIKDPYEALKQLFSVQENSVATKDLKFGIDFVVLPLFSLKSYSVFERSGLNQWNAAPRNRSNPQNRNADDVYIPIPMQVAERAEGFFPERGHQFLLKLPNGIKLEACTCQDNGRNNVGKGLESTPNSDLGHWLLRDVLRIPERKLVTMDLLNENGFNSVILYKEDEFSFSIDVCNIDDYMAYFVKNNEID